MVELFDRGGQGWAGGDDAGGSVSGSGGLAEGKSRVGVDFGNGVSP